MATQYGLTLEGFVPKQQSVIISEIQASLQQAFGQSINLLPESVFGQLVGVFSEREALLWQLAEAVYQSQYPSGAEGTSVDNLLAYNALKREPATPSRASLELYGTPGTIIPKLSIVQSTAVPPASFTTDADATIQVAENSIQTLIFTSVPTVGHFTISIEDPAGNTLTTANINYNDNAAAVQTKIRALADGMTTPYSDVVVTGSYGAGFTIECAGGVSGSKFQNPFVVVTNTLLDSSTVVNISVFQTQLGTVAKAVVDCTCTVTGPTYAPSGTITVIGSPVSGWSGVSNPIDATVGTNIETDTQALARRATQLAAAANGPLQAIVDKVLARTGVTAAVGFENTANSSDNSTMILRFSAVPDSGNFTLSFGSPVQTTGTLAYNATAANIQTAIQALSGYSATQVDGTFADGFFIFFGSTFVNQADASVATNTLQHGVDPVAVTITGRPPKSFEIVVEGGTTADLADTIWRSKPAGIESYGNVGPTNIFDVYGNAFPIYFSRPSEVPIYISIDMTVDQATFPANGVIQIQEDLVAIGQALGIGATVILFGTNGLVGAFNNVPGIISYTLKAGIAPSPTLSVNIDMEPSQLPQFSSSNIIITLTYA